MIEHHKNPASNVFNQFKNLYCTILAMAIFIGPVTLKDLQRELNTLKTRLVKNEGKIEQTATKLDTLEETVADDRAKTLLLLADHCERLDQQSNMAKSHCVLITGNKITIIQQYVWINE